MGDDAISFWFCHKKLQNWVDFTKFHVDLPKKITNIYILTKK